MALENLEKDIKKYLCDEFLSDTTSNYVSKKTVAMRLLEKISSILNLSETDTCQKLIYVHPECSLAIENIIKTIGSSSSVKIIEDTFSSDYHTVQKLNEFSDFLEDHIKIDPDMIHKLNIVYAVDGFNETSYKNYIVNLQYSLSNIKSEILKNKSSKEIHVQAVRYLYRKYGKSLEPKEIFEALSNDLIENYPGKLCELMKDYMNFVNSVRRES